ncbi:hypothetical protein [Wolbachia endosymbiont of Pentidionis agamae]|uniref:hypothetical protein n=1 Tax=Wolbachia endosymbiont of Pentidionis agamae TaxID=3110435 RepID=UPI002FD67481
MDKEGYAPLHRIIMEEKLPLNDRMIMLEYLLKQKDIDVNLSTNGEYKMHPLFMVYYMGDEIPEDLKKRTILLLLKHKNFDFNANVFNDKNALCFINSCSKRKDKKTPGPIDFINNVITMSTNHKEDKEDNEDNIDYAKFIEDFLISEVNSVFWSILSRNGEK